MNAAAYAQLRADIERRGIQTPLDITEEGVLLDGRSRLQAASSLGHEDVPVRIVAPDDEAEYIVLAAIERRHMTPSQTAALLVEWSRFAELREAGAKRQLQNLRQYAEGATLPPRGKLRDILARRASVSARTVQDAITAFEGDRQLFEQVKAGALAAPVAARRVRRARRDAALPPASPLPEGPFDLVYADPPWQLGCPDGAHAPENHYATLPLAEIKAQSFPAAENAVLFLWAVNMLLPEALEVMEAWGFTYKAQLVWVKPSPGIGNWVRNQHELLLIGREGSFPPPDPEDRFGSVIEAKRGRHSEKPACVYELIERMYPHASKLELFARGKSRPGWASWGNEAEPAEEREAAG